MLKKVLWIAAACAAILVALAVSRNLGFDKPRPADPPPAPEAPEAPAVVAEPVAPPPAVEAPPPPPTPEDLQVQEDAAATGMTTVEPEEPPSEAPPT